MNRAIFVTAFTKMAGEEDLLARSTDATARLEKQFWHLLFNNREGKEPLTGFKAPQSTA
jgi:hypothetical protein